MPRPIKFGEIDGIEEDLWFEGRKEMMPTSFHRNWGRGIDGNGMVLRELLLLYSLEAMKTIKTWALR
ncbi:hypothetical protein [Rhodohalobacter sp. 8-1]|uniref:hypothetical protein n=1 Tax=Rhodohalobacter sp. 8-1 TaxID=3131972 RepID=UPI0030ED367C